IRGALLQIGTADRVPIHRGVVPRREIDGAGDVFREHCIQRVPERTPLGRERLELADDEARRFGGRHGGKIFARSQARLATDTSHDVSLNRNTGNGAWYSRSSVTMATQSAGSCSASSKMGLGPATVRYTSIFGSGSRLNPSTSTMSASLR